MNTQTENILPSFSTQKERLEVVLSLLKVEKYIQHRISTDFHNRISETCKETLMLLAKKKPKKIRNILNKSLSIKINGAPSNKTITIEIMIDNKVVFNENYPFTVLLKPYEENCAMIDIQEKIESFVESLSEKEYMFEKIYNMFYKLLFST